MTSPCDGGGVGGGRQITQRDIGCLSRFAAAANIQCERRDERQRHQWPIVCPPTEDFHGE